MRRIQIGVATCGLLLLAVGFVRADQTVSVTTDCEVSTLVSLHANGDVLTIPLLVASDRNAGVFGAELALSAATDDIVIRSVTFDAAFSRAAGDISPTVASAVAAEASSNGSVAPVVADDGANALPGLSYRAVRTQSVTALDPSLGANNHPVLLATVEVEIRNSAPFESTLNVHARGSLVAAPEEGDATDDANAQTVGDGVSHTVIKILNTAPPPPRPVEVWVERQESLTAEVRDALTGQAVTTLTAGNDYELHYDAHSESVNGYALFVVAEDVGQSIANVGRPDSGEWSNTLMFNHENALAAYGYAPSADGYPDGFWRYATVSDNLLVSGTTAGSTGHLFNFVPEAAGTLRLQLTMRRIDTEAREVVEMEDRIELTVE